MQLSYKLLHKSTSTMYTEPLHIPYNVWKQPCPVLYLPWLEFTYKRAIQGLHPLPHSYTTYLLNYYLAIDADI